MINLPRFVTVTQNCLDLETLLQKKALKILAGRSFSRVDAVNTVGVTEHGRVDIKAECLALSPRVEASPGWRVLQRAEKERTRGKGPVGREKSDPPCIIPFERHFKNGLSAARLLTSGVDA
jgi:hypothetical protein